MACAACGHDDHAPGPCTACAATNAPCWTGIKITGGDGEKVATGQIEMATGVEQRPCMICRSFEQDRDKLVRHLLRNKLTPDDNGVFTTPIARDFAGRNSLKIDPKSFGWCRKQTIVVDFMATCPDFRAVRTQSELESRIKP